MMLKWNFPNWITIVLMASVWYFGILALLSLFPGGGADNGAEVDAGAVVY
jgi:hypothetical protein